jgi:hypothetical protein
VLARISAKCRDYGFQNYVGVWQANEKEREDYARDMVKKALGIASFSQIPKSKAVADAVTDLIEKYEAYENPGSIRPSTQSIHKKQGIR